MTHTPGPWRMVMVEGVANFAAVLGPPEFNEMVGTATYLDDANLIAMSPEMLDLLDIFVDCHPAQIEPLKSRARHIIAKATGEKI